MHDGLESEPMQSDASVSPHAFVSPVWPVGLAESRDQWPVMYEEGQDGAAIERIFHSVASDMDWQ